MNSFNLDQFLPYRLNLLAARISRELAQVYSSRFGLSIPEWRVIAHLSQSGEVSVREIHARVEMDKSKVSRAAARLEAAGLVEKHVNTTDRRLVVLSLTPKGRALMAKIAPLAKEYEAALRTRLGPQAASFDAAIDHLLEE